MKSIVVGILIIVIVVTLAACGGGKSAVKNEDNIVIKFSHEAAPDSIKGKGAQKFAELAAAKTGGKVKVEVYPSSQLYTDKEELEALMAGNVHMIAPSVSKLVKLDPIWQYVDMPFLFRDRDHVFSFFRSDVARQLLGSKQLVSNDIKGLAFWANDFKQFTNSKRPLRNIDDFQGVKFRTQAGKVLESQFKSLGSGSATISSSEIYTALQQGVVDGTELSLNNIDTLKIYEVQKYLTISNHGRVDYAVLVNQTFWNNIPPDIRTQVEAALSEATEFQWKTSVEDSDKSLDLMRKTGKIEISELTNTERSELEKVMYSVYEEFSNAIKPEFIEEIRKIE